MENYLSDSSLNGEEYEDPRCKGCQKPIDDGSVVQFGDGIWHFECFRCTKCNELVECYSNLLLLQDGSPVCENCSYCCHVCAKPIKDEAIMTGDEAYHADCFRCVQCNTKIEDLVFTQTSKGIFCTQCHEARKLLRQKRKEEKQRQLQRQQEMEQSGRMKHQGVQEDYFKNRFNTILDTKSSTTASSSSTLDAWLTSPVDRQMSTNAILNDYVDRPPVLPPKEPMLPTIAPAAKPRDLPSLDTSFTPQELIELNKMLNAAIESGLNDNIPSPPPDASPKDLDPSSDLASELASTKARLWDMESKFNQIKNISRKALEEFNKVKEAYQLETLARQETEAKTLKLQDELSFYHHLNIFGAAEFKQYSREELANLHQLRQQMEGSVRNLRQQRDQIMDDIEKKKLAHWDLFSQTTQLHLQSLQHDADHAKLGYARLSKARDNIISEMILLNTKNAELSTLNNDLSRRVTEREREAIAVMAGTSFLNQERSSLDNGRQSPEPVPKHSSTARRSNIKTAATVAPKLFKFGRNRSKSNSSDHDNQLISVPYDNRPMPSSAAAESLDIQRVHRHAFLPVKFLRPTKCEVCNDKVWGTTEMKCQGCQMICHHKCIYRSTTCQHKTSTDATTNYDAKGGIFGNNLIQQVQSENDRIPLVVRKCIEAVESRAMDYEGIYRKSGGAGQMRLIQQAFEKHDTPNLDDADQWNDICAVTSVLKQYFRDLPVPLMTFDHNQKFIDVIVGDGNKAEGMQAVLQCLPIEHFNTLKYLMEHLARVKDHQTENLMTSKNLAVVFGPTLMRHEAENLDLVEMNHKISCIEFLLNHMDVFNVPMPQINRSAPLPTRKNSLPTRHRRDGSFGLANIARDVAA
ncbi:RhoGAP-domain-containing protein [Hesseltinella vesiculosa]|uniref:RhoGAP-domain-containing protein n=1 Tax=Hesseltinella vesiculosa TaxID=101127 RepID=A0A1X2GHA4_9FUNG|nr:RhoGAP-domain-containing protein [Hesseltinella vesiculosa]